jgi:hypothetical protein
MISIETENTWNKIPRQYRLVDTDITNCHIVSNAYKGHHDSLPPAANTTVFIHSVLVNKLSLVLKVTGKVTDSAIQIKGISCVCMYVYNISGGVANIFYQSCAQIDNNQQVYEAQIQVPRCNSI